MLLFLLIRFIIAGVNFPWRYNFAVRKISFSLAFGFFAPATYFLGTPFLAIPYPFAKDDHQFYNAKYYVKKNLGWLIRETNVKKNFLYKFVTNLIKNKKIIFQKKKNMHIFHKKYDWAKNSNLINKLI